MHLLGNTNWSEVNIINNEDDAIYKEYINTTIICFDPGTGVSIPKSPSTTQNWSQQEVIGRVVEKLVNIRLHSHNKDMNIIAQGYRKTSEGRYEGLMHNKDVECFFPNTVLNHIKSPTWEKILSRCGDHLMFWLFCNTSMFIIASHGCYIQIVGNRIADIISKRDNSKFIPKQKKFWNPEALKKEKERKKEQRKLKKLNKLKKENIQKNSEEKNDKKNDQQDVGKDKQEVTNIEIKNLEATKPIDTTNNEQKKKKKENKQKKKENERR